MWAVLLPQVAATLAVALTAYQAKDAVGNRLIDEADLYSVLVLVVVSSVLGPVLTEVFGKPHGGGATRRSSPSGNCRSQGRGRARQQPLVSRAPCQVACGQLQATRREWQFQRKFALCLGIVHSSRETRDRCPCLPAALPALRVGL